MALNIEMFSIHSQWNSKRSYIDFFSKYPKIDPHVIIRFCKNKATLRELID